MNAKSRILAKNLVKKLAIMLVSFDYNKYTILHISRATLTETFPAIYDCVLPRTPQARPGSEIYTPRRDDEHPSPYYTSPSGIIESDGCWGKTPFKE